MTSYHNRHLLLLCLVPQEPPTALRSTFRWEGREHPTEEALQYNRARTFDPSMGRWLSADPLGDAGSEQVATHPYPRTV